MIESITISNFKSLRRVELSLGMLNLFVGTNASGKSNFLESLRVLQGIGNGFTISEILDGRPPSATSEVWDGIRGGSSRTCFAGFDGESEVLISVQGTLDDEPQVPWHYSITFLPMAGQVKQESLQAGVLIFHTEETSGPDSGPKLRVHHHYVGGDRSPISESASFRPVLGGFSGLKFFGFSGDSVGFDQGPFYTEGADLARRVARQLANTQQLEPSIALLREYSKVHDAKRMGDHGENFAAVVKTICQNEDTKDAFLSWLRELRPDEVDDVGTLSGAVGDSLFMLRESHREYPAPVLSAGTLRFAALTAAFFQPDMPSIMTIEEIENGIHASRLRLLLELLRNRSRAGRTQVFATTHSPSALAWLDESEYGTTFLCKRDESTGESMIRPLTEVPHFLDVAQRHPVADLYAEGWLETAL
ncbi:MAG: AAA family ATPase [Spirochaetaceae bacterium]|nr:AAA family ATPase [Spirochaetaceae bacterium]